MTGCVFESISVCMFTLSMLDVNKYLNLFFNQVGVKSYPNKTIAVIIASIFLIVVNYDSLFLLKSDYQMPTIYFYLTGWLYILMRPVLYLTVTAGFIFLADFGFNTRDS